MARKRVSKVQEKIRSDQHGAAGKDTGRVGAVLAVMQ
jgi:hypothetical protein